MNYLLFLGSRSVDFGVFVRDFALWYLGVVMGVARTDKAV